VFNTGEACSQCCSLIILTVEVASTREAAYYSSTTVCLVLHTNLVVEWLERARGEEVLMAAIHHRPIDTHTLLYTAPGHSPCLISGHQQPAVRAPKPLRNTICLFTWWWSGLSVPEGKRSFRRPVGFELLRCRMYACDVEVVSSRS
jgi:hypothetical protein